MTVAPCIPKCHKRMATWLKKLFQKVKPTITHKISESNSNFNLKIAHSGESLISIFKELSSSINKTFVLARRLDIRLSFYVV